MASIHKKKYKNVKGQIKTYYNVIWRDLQGKQHSKSYRTQSEAKAHLHLYTANSTGNITFGEIFNCFLAYSKNEHAYSTYTNYKMYADKVFKQYYTLRYDKISSIELEQMFMKLQNVRGQYAAQLCLKLGKVACNYAKKHQMINENKFEQVTNIKIVPKEKEHLTISEQKHILNVCKIVYPQYYALLYTFIATGMREGEIFALNKEDVHFSEVRNLPTSITINKQFTKGILKAPKTKASKRKIIISDNLSEVLRQHISASNNSTNLLFSNKNGGFLNATNIRERFWKPLLKYAEIHKHVRLHDIRGSYIDALLASDVSPKFAQAQVGHSKIQTTLDIYAQNSMDIQDNAYSKLNEIL